MQRPPSGSPTSQPTATPSPSAPPVASQAPGTPPPAALPASTPTQAAADVTPTPPPQRAQITYADSQLTVSASNASLNQILREISRQTGTKITGGVADERVFGTYGPAPPAKILGALLDGTGSNVLIVQSPGDQPAAAPVELVLTPRHGGPTPPNPNAAGFNDSEDPPLDGSPVPMSQPRRGNPGPDQIQPLSPSTALPGGLPSSVDTPGNPATTQEQPSNGVKTPQQIYDQLLKLRQQSQQPQPQ